MGEFRTKGEGADKIKQKKGKEEKRKRRKKKGGTRQGGQNRVGPLASPIKVQKQF
ncbi:hypothetical protein D8674_020693 [Pyrus ussuriensis x Pyrus communis]|uniref:Uncharacterized protein n=1 Tax=Pyrus ussuriensis x Pyrus communis TaxID=2448454 RepID=A0A5N5HGU8_9ROSA|nr:hypothetical protein D8674_020693 [Pyrus ussuriensis x Pyrus communis]